MAMKEQVIKLQTGYSDAYTLIATCLSAGEAQQALGNVFKSVAEGVYNMVIGLMDKYPDDPMSIIEQKFDDEVTNALMRHAAEDHIQAGKTGTVEDDGKINRFMKPVRTVRTAFEKELNFRDFTSIRSIQDECTRLNKVELEDKRMVRMEKAAEDLATRNGTSKELELERMKQARSQPVDKPDNKDESTLKQQLPSDIQIVLDETIALLVEVHKAKPEKAVNLLNSFNVQTNQAAKAIGKIAGAIINTKAANG